MNQYTPNRSLNTSFNRSAALDKSLVLIKRKQTLNDSFWWLGVNVVILAIILYDLLQTCPMYMNYYHYVEYTILLLLTLNILFYIGRIVRLWFSKGSPIPVTLEQKKLLKVTDADPNYTLISPSKTPMKATPSKTSPLNLTGLGWQSPSSPPQQSTPLNMTAYSWRSNVSQEKHSPAWHYSNEDKDDDVEEEQQKDKTNLLSSFWSHPVTQTTTDMAALLGKTVYQLSAPSPTKSTASSKAEESFENSVSSMEVWHRINVDTVTLTNWNENLRVWISQTILERLVKEFDNINESLVKHNMSDVKVGHVGLDRLRKTALMPQITQFIPTLGTIVPFLEVHQNQEYLVSRIRELAQGGCMSDFKWNKGNLFNGRGWDETLPADSTIIMHLISCYLDTQIMPLPSQPDKKPFSGVYLQKMSDKTTPVSEIYIKEIDQKPPHYRVVIGQKTYEMVKGYNNLFHTLLFFIFNVDKLEGGMLGRVCLGKAGVNMLWIIGLNE